MFVCCRTGLNDINRENSWVWVSDGTPLNSTWTTAWGTGEPNLSTSDIEDCVDMTFSNKLRDLDCSLSKSYVCA